MIDINELRKVIADCYWPTSPVAINKLLDHLEAAEKERDALRAKAEAVEKNLRCCQAEREEAAALFLSVKTKLLTERDALRAKIADMEKQEPAGWQRLYEDGSSTEDIVDSPNVFAHQRPLYALPGAQGEEK